MPWLVSFATYRKIGLDRRYYATASSILVDSGAYSQLTNPDLKIDLGEYRDFCDRWPHAEAWAGLDDIGGDWKRSMANYQAFETSFPTFHDTDPPELLGELIAMAQERNQWIGIGLKPPREGKEAFVRRTLEQIPDDLHVHGWALYRYAHLRLGSVDSNNWSMDTMKILNWGVTAHLTPAEAIEIVVKRYQRMEVLRDDPASAQMEAFHD